MRNSNGWRKVVSVWAVLAMLMVLTTGAAATSVTNKLQNGSFEEGQTWSGSYQQPDQSKVPAWYTTASDGRIELFRQNTGVYISGIRLTPAQGTYAAELNADEESTLYQILQTEPSSRYEWSLYHGSRSAQDTLALIIGPNQADENGECLLSKPSKAGRDQFMQMIDWLKEPGNGYDDKNYVDGLYNNGTPITLYSKKFAAGGTFQDNAADNAFSLTPSAIYTEAWSIWLMRDKCAASGDNPWTQYGSKLITQDETGQEEGVRTTDNAYYQYMVPAGQTNSLFGFVSVDSSGKNKTYGNFLDCVNFAVNRRLTASSTANGTATITGQNVSPLSVSVDHSVSAYVPDEAELTLTATIEPEDADSVVFAGAFYRRSNQQPVFIANNASNWTEEEAEDGSRHYVHKLVVDSACDLHFVFVKSPMITYDANGGDPYDCGQSETERCIYNFQPEMVNGVPVLVEPYTSHAATKTTAAGADPDWRFVGWMLMDDNGNVEMLEDESGEHRVACNYSFNTGSSGTLKKQEFLVIGRKNPNGALPAFGTSEIDEDDGNGNVFTLKRWSAPDTAQGYYDDAASGLTFIAQWEWRQTYTPMLKREGVYERSGDGGRIDVYVRTADENGEPVLGPAATEPPEGDGISQCYFAQMQETMSVTATANAGYEFEGWYTPDGTLVTTHNTLSYVVGKGDVKVYEARFSGTAKQRYIRQITDENGNWIEVPEDANVPELDHAGYEVSPGTAVTCTSGADTEDYSFEGWYEVRDGSFVRVDPALVINGGRTLAYTVTGDATYYARFIPKVRFVACYVGSDNRVTSAPVSGEIFGTVSPEEVSKLPGEQISSKAAAGTGYRFVGWYDGVGEDRTLLSRDALYSGEMPPVGKTYYAMFTTGDNSRYRVQHIKVKPDGSEETVSTALISSVPTGSRVSAQAITIPGYLYRSDSFTVNGNTCQSNPAGVVRGDGQLVLKLYYTPLTDMPYSIEYYQLDAYGNESLKDCENKAGKTDETVSVTDYADRYQSDGYSFAAGYGKNRLTGVVTAQEPLLVLKVYYRPMMHRVTFNMHGFGAQVPMQLVAHQQTASKPDDPVALGYVFGGWYTDADYTGLYDFDTPVTEDIELHARWNMIWPVTFDMQGHGEQIPMQKVEDGRFATRPSPDPTAEGYVFHGWYQEASCETEYGFEELPIKAPTTIYAKWTANVTVTKVWEGGGKAPVTVRLLRDGLPYEDMPEAEPVGEEPVEQTCEMVLEPDNSWTHTWTNLPADSVYTVEEAAVPGNCTAVYSSVADNDWIITNVWDKRIEVEMKNTHRRATIDMVIRKEWDDADNRHRPGSVRVQIKNAATGEVVAEIALSAANAWTWRVTELPRMQSGGQPIRYLVEEVGDLAGYSVACDIVVEADGSYTVKLTNVLTGKLDITGEKLWDDGNDRDGLRPDSIQLKIYQNAIAKENLVRIVLVTAAADSTADEPWVWNAENLPVYDAFGRPITYIVVEDPVPEGYADPGPRRITVGTE